MFYISSARLVQQQQQQQQQIKLQSVTWNYRLYRKMPKTQQKKRLNLSQRI
jgi:hypothetical protein